MNISDWRLAAVKKPTQELGIIRKGIETRREHYMTA